MDPSTSSIPTCPSRLSLRPVERSSRATTLSEGGTGAEGPAQVGADEAGPAGHDDVQRVLRAARGCYRGHADVRMRRAGALSVRRWVTAWD